MRRQLVHLLYNTLLPAALVAALPGAVAKMRRRGGYGRNFRERFGRYGPDARARLAEPQDVWIHAVSVGEVGIARKLVRGLLEADPGLRITLSTTTSTGHAVALRDAPEALTVIYSPLDLPWIVERACEQIRPRRLVLVEAEVWPNLVARADADGVPVILVNARMSDRSAARFRRFRGLVGPVFAQLERILVQEPDDIPRWTELGVPGERLMTTGSLKYDQEGESPPQAPPEFSAMLDAVWGAGPRRVLLLASTHAGEEASLAAVYRDVRSSAPDLRLIIVPRHFERTTDEVIPDLEAIGLHAVRRSGFPAAPRPGATAEQPSVIDQSGEPKVFVVDSTGELARWIALADAVVMGKSFLTEGGQNPVEAVTAGKPVVFGPHMENFRPIVRMLLAANGAIQVADRDALRTALKDLLAQPDHARALADGARAALEPHHGAVRRAVDLILSLPRRQPSENFPLHSTSKS